MLILLEIYNKHGGNITNREIVKLLGEDEKAVAVWKSGDKWNVVQQSNESCITNKKGAQPSNKSVFDHVVVNREGTFLDGNQVSDVTIHDFHLDRMSMIKRRLEVPKDAEHVGKLTIFGRGFGNYNQDIEVNIDYKLISELERLSQND